MANIAFDVQGADRADITHLSRDPANGRIVLKVAGTSATPAGAPGGDTTLAATLNGDVKGTAPVIVSVPNGLTPADASVQNLANGFQGEAPIVRQCLSSATSPADLRAQPPMVALDGLAVLPEPISVFDQFWDDSTRSFGVLEAVYNGSIVYEDDEPINVAVYDGSYLDPVGVATRTSTIVDISTPEGAAEAAAWPNGGDPVSFQAGSLIVALQVSVAGQNLDEYPPNSKADLGKLNRQVSWIPTQNGLGIIITDAWR